MDPIESARFTLHVRSFIPTHKVAGGFHGDDRGFSVSGHGTSRIHATVDLDPLAHIAKQLNAASDATYGPIGFIGPLGGDYAHPKSAIQTTALDRGTKYDLRLSGANPIVPGSPDADVRAQVSIQQTGPDTFHIHATISGDSFPAHEAVLQISGQNIFLGGRMPEANSSPLGMVGNADQQESSLDFNVRLDNGGKVSKLTDVVFQKGNTQIGNSNTFTVSGWNRAVMQMLTPDNMPSPEAVKSVPEKSHGLENSAKVNPKGGMNR